MSNNRKKNRGKGVNQKAKPPVSALATTVKAMAPTVLVRPAAAADLSPESLRANTLKNKAAGFVAGMSKAAMRFVPVSDRYFGGRAAAKKRLAKVAKEAGKRQLLVGPAATKIRKRSFGKRLLAFMAALTLTVSSYGAYQYHKAYGHFPFMNQRLAETSSSAEKSSKIETSTAKGDSGKAKVVNRASTKPSKSTANVRSASKAKKSAKEKAFSKLSQAEKRKIWQQKLAKLKQERARHLRKTRTSK